MPVPVTEQEKQSPLYKYFEMSMAAPAPGLYEAFESSLLPPDKLLKPQEMNRLFDDGYLPCEFGYGRLEDGTVTLANLTPMPGVTPEMIDWWFAWHGLEPLRYKIWDRDEHMSAITREPEKARDSSLTMKERYWDTTHDVKEAMTPGGPVQDIEINFRNPADVGFDESRLRDFKGTIICAGNERSPVIMCHFVRPTEEGCELRTRFWMGYKIAGGKPEKAIPDGAEFPIEAASELLKHNIKEFANLAALLPKVYEEYREAF